MRKNQKFAPTKKRFRQINYLAFSFEKLCFHEIFAKKVRVRENNFTNYSLCESQSVVK